MEAVARLVQSAQTYFGVGDELRAVLFTLQNIFIFGVEVDGLFGVLLRFRFSQVTGLDLVGDLRLEGFDPPDLIVLLLAQHAQRLHELLFLIGVGVGFLFERKLRLL